MVDLPTIQDGINLFLPYLQTPVGLLLSLGAIILLTGAVVGLFHKR